MRIRILLFAAICALTVGCALQAGLPEFKVYNTAFEELRSASTTIIDMLAVAERKQRQAFLKALHANGFDKKFAPDTPHLFELADPPLADVYRRGIDVVAQYNKIMLVYATGQGFDTLQAEVSSLGTESLALVNAAQILGDVAGKASPYVALAQEIAKLALSIRSRAVFREHLIDTAPAVRKLLGSMRDGTRLCIPASDLYHDDRTEPAACRRQR